MQLLFAQLKDSALPKDDRELKDMAGELENILTELSSMIIIFPTDYFPSCRCSSCSAQRSTDCCHRAAIEPTTAGVTTPSQLAPKRQGCTS